MAGSLPLTVVTDCFTSEGAKFVNQDRLLDACQAGPRWLATPKVADGIVRVLLQGQTSGRYDLGAWVLMPNHVHLILRPEADLSRVLSGIKASTAREANRILDRAGKSFWARDYFDRWIRDRNEEQRIIRYIERNPVKAGLCAIPEQWQWSTANPKFARPDTSS